MTTRPRHSLTKIGVATATTIAATAVAFGSAHTAQAASFEVDTLSDNPADGYTLREAITDANVDALTDTITFAPGLTGTIALTAQLDILHDVRIIGPNADALTLDGGHAHRVIHSMAPGTGITLQGMTIANGSTAGPGGGIVFHDGDFLILDDVVVRDNETADIGGGILRFILLHRRGRKLGTDK